MTAPIAKPGLSPFVMDDEATWYMEMLKASAIQNSRRDSQVRFRSSDSNGIESRFLLERMPSLAFANEPGYVCNLSVQQSLVPSWRTESLELDISTKVKKSCCRRGGPCHKCLGTE